MRRLDVDAASDTVLDELLLRKEGLLSEGVVPVEKV